MNAITKKGKTTQKEHRLRLLSYNIHQCATIHQRKIALPILKEAIKATRADVVLLQEVAGPTEGERQSSKKRPWVTSFQLEELADEIWPHFAYQKNAVFFGGFHGNAILSRLPFVSSQNIDISIKPLIRRGLLHAVLQYPGVSSPIHMMAVHLGLLQFERERQIKMVAKFMQKEIPRDATCFLGGDFNDWRKKVSRELVGPLGMKEAFQEKYAKYAKTFPSRMPILSLDRIYYRSATLANARCLRGRPWRHLSDHLPLYAEFLITE